MEGIMALNIYARDIELNNNSFKQSANSLFNFMRKIEYLKLIIENKAFIPRYYEELIPYLELERFSKIAFPMTCFCDINIKNIYDHCEFYGFIGLGMDKNWGIDNGIQPIQYLNENSRLGKELKKIFITEDDENNEIVLEPYKNYLLEHVLFIKPIAGKMLARGKYVPKNFHDEKEWRYIPNITEEYDIPEVLTFTSYMNEKGYKIYSESIKEYKNLWLKFEYEDIKYIFVENKDDLDDLINFIIELNIDNKDKYTLISKIITLEVIKEDI
jgi:hypothetical protein